MHRLPVKRAWVIPVAAAAVALAAAVAPFSVRLEFYPNRVPRQLSFLWNGEKMLTEWHWYDDGALMASWPYADGLPHGDWRMWWPDGKVKSLRRYDRGVIDGEVWGWHANGQLSDFNVYDKGRELTHKSWISDGTPYYNYVYQEGRKVGIRGGDYCKRLNAVAK